MCDPVYFIPQKYREQSMSTHGVRELAAEFFQSSWKQYVGRGV